MKKLLLSALLAAALLSACAQKPVVVPPKLIAAGQVAYPPIAQERGEEGTVQLSVIVDTQGQMESVKVQTSSGHRRLDSAAARAARENRFAPGTINGKPAVFRVFQSYVFRLDDVQDGQPDQP